ncbi:hypothetical protein ACIRQY_17055 [Streptomyces sp. NPDC101490]
MRCAFEGLQTVTAHVPLMYLYEEKHPMNVITNLLAGVFHFLGWLV